MSEPVDAEVIGEVDPNSALPYVVLVYMGEAPCGPLVKAYTAMDQMDAHRMAELSADCGKPSFLIDLWGEGDRGPTIERYKGEFGAHILPPTRGSGEGRP